MNIKSSSLRGQKGASAVHYITFLPSHQSKSSRQCCCVRIQHEVLQWHIKCEWLIKGCRHSVKPQNFGKHNETSDEMMRQCPNIKLFVFLSWHGAIFDQSCFSTIGFAHYIIKFLSANGKNRPSVLYCNELWVITPVKSDLVKSLEAPCRWNVGLDRIHRLPRKAHAKLASLQGRGRSDTGSQPLHVHTHSSYQEYHACMCWSRNSCIDFIPSPSERELCCSKSNLE